jgi:PAS domain S-box-containing protein
MIIYKVTNKVNGKYKAIFRNAAVGIFIVDAEGRFFEINEAFCAMVGYSEKQLKGMNCNQISHPDDKHLHAEFFGKLSRGEVERYNIEKRLIHSIGEDVWVRLTFSAIRDEDDGEFLYSIAVVENITPQKQAEHELENALSNIILDWNVNDIERDTDRQRLKTVVSNLQL